MPQVSDRAAIRALLELDRPWSVYALGDLAAGPFAKSTWFCGGNGVPALVLLYRGFDTPVFFALGNPPDVKHALEVPAQSCGPRPNGGRDGAHVLSEVPRIYLHIRPNILPLIEANYVVQDKKAMWRMILDHRDFRPAPGNNAIRLGATDLPALQRLYHDSEGPEWFVPEMVTDGVYFGVRDGDELVAAGGTHLVVPEEGVAAIGNVFTRRDCRGRGLGGSVTCAVAAELLRRQIRTVALNVYQLNTSAIGIYERLGFARYCEFVEGLAVAADFRSLKDFGSLD